MTLSSRRPIRRLARALRAGACAVAAYISLSCDPARKDTLPATPSEPSPNAAILPAPLAADLEPGQDAPRDAGRALDAGDASVASAVTLPEPFREDVAPDADAPLRDVTGVRLRGRMRWLDLPPFPRLPESNVEAGQRLRDALDFELSFDVAAAGRLRVVLESDAFVLPRGTEFRARGDHLGHVVVWDAGGKYAVLQPGTLRAVLSERRADKAPLMKPKSALLSDGHWLGLATERRELTTPLGRVVLDLASVAAAGSGGELVCRWLLDLVAADPLNPACSRSLVPLRAEIFSGGGGHVALEIQRLERDTVFDATALLVPPASARFVPGDLPPETSSIVPAPERLRELRLRPAPRQDKPAASAPKQGLVIQNKSESLRYVLLDGIALARVPAHREVYVEGLLPGKYALATLDFLGDEPTPLRIIELPTRVAVGDDLEPAR